MTDDKPFDPDALPDLPSDEELGISSEDYELLDDQGEIREDLPAGKEPGSDVPRAGAGKASDGRAKRGETREKRRKEKKAGRRSWFSRRRARKTAARSGGGRGAEGSAGGPEGPAGPEDTEGVENRAAAAGASGPLVLAGLVVVGWLSMSERSRPPTQPANAPPETFSSARAMTDLVEIARDRHPIGSPDHARVLSYLTQRLEALDLEPETQTATALARIGDHLRAATVRNLIGRLPGTESTGTILLAAHYDSRSQSLGAGDDGSGVVAILEAIRAFREGPPPRNDVMVLLTDGEEAGLMGARAFARDHPALDDVALVLNFEMRGSGGASIMFETGSENGWVVRRLRDATPWAMANSMSEEVYARLPLDTDFSVFKAVGKQGMNFATVGRPNHYHQRHDSPENLDEAALQHHGEHLLSLLRHVADTDLRSLDGDDAVFFRVPFVGLVVYDDRWVIPFGMLLVLLGVAVVFIGTRRGMRARGVVAGFALAVASIGASAALGRWFFDWLVRFHPEYGSLQQAAFHSEGWYVLALVAAVFTLLVLLLSLLRRWFSPASLTLGAMVPGLVAAIVLTVWAPLAAMNLQWPVLAALLGAGVAGLVGRTGAGWLTAALALLFAVPVLVFFVPVVELLWLAMSLSLAPVLAALVATGMLLVLPALDPLRRPNWWWAPAVGVVGAGVFLGLGLLHARPSAERPAPSTLLYALDRETGEALWATANDTTNDSPGAAWVEARAAGFSGEESLDRFKLARHLDLKVSTEPYRVAAGDPVLAPEPEVALASDSVLDGGRLVSVRISSRIVAERLAVGLPGTAPLRAVNGRELPERDVLGEPVTAPPVELDHWGAPEGAVTLSFEVPLGATGLDLVLVEHLLRPEELLGTDPFVRPPDLTPNVRRLSDRAMIRTPIRLELGRSGETSVLTAPQAEGLASDSAAAGPEDPGTTVPADAATATSSDSASSAEPDAESTTPPDSARTAEPDSAGTAGRDSARTAEARLPRGRLQAGR